MRALLFKSLPLFALLAIVAVATALQPLAQKHRPSEVEAILEARMLPKEVSRVLTFGFGSVLADAAYLQAIQVASTPSRHSFSDVELGRKGLAAWRLLDYATDVDPLFAYAYVLGANIIPVDLLDGSALNVQETVALLEKGTSAVEKDWRIPFNLSYFRSAHLLDFAGAATAMARAVEAGGGPAYLPLLATRLSAQGGAIETGLALAAAMRENAVDDEQRELYEARIRLLEMERDLRIIEAAAEAFEERNGYRPGALSELLSSRDLAVIPREPHGGSYEYDPISGVARSTAAKRMRVFDPMGDGDEESEGDVSDDSVEGSGEGSVAGSGEGAGSGPSAALGEEG